MPGASKSQIRANILKDKKKNSLPDSGKLKVHCGHTTFNVHKITAFLFRASENVIRASVFLLNLYLSEWASGNKNLCSTLIEENMLIELVIINYSNGDKKIEEKIIKLMILIM